MKMGLAAVVAAGLLFQSVSWAATPTAEPTRGRTETAQPPPGPAAPPAAPSAEGVAEEEALLGKLGKLKSDFAGQSLSQMIRDLKSPEQRRAACVYVLALVNGDVPAFMSLVPSKGLVIEKTETKTKEKVSAAEMQRRAQALGPAGRPRFGDVLNEASDVAPKDLDWGVQEVKGKLRISANGAFAWATLSKATDGRYLLERLTISTNDD